MKLRLSNTELHTYYNHYKILESKFERGQFIDDLARDMNVHPSTINRHFKAWEKNGYSAKHRKDKGEPRIVNGITLTKELQKEITMKLAAAKIALATKEGSTGETGRIAEALYRAGEIPVLVPRTTANRWLNQYNYSFRQIRRYAESTSNRLFTDRPNRWWFVDGSVSELFYLGGKGKIIKDTIGISKDKNHFEEILTKKGYRKLLIFIAVDLYSKAYYVNAYVTPGESSAIWMRFLMDAFHAKEDTGNPFRGIPENIYSDRGSGLLHSASTREMLESLGIHLEDHFPGNSKAKGVVEARVRAYKLGIERYFRFEKIETLERYRELKDKFIIADNIKKGYYELWTHIHKHPGALREFDSSLRGRIGYVSFEQKVNPYGCVTIDNIEYFIDRRLNGEWIWIYRLADGTMKAQDRQDRIFTITELDQTKQNVQMGTFRSDKKTAFDNDLETIETEAKRLAKTIPTEYFIPSTEDSNVVLFDRPGVQAEVDSPLDEALIQTAADAWYRIVMQTGCSKRDLPGEIAEKVDWLLNTIIEKDGAITMTRFVEIKEIVQDTMRELQESCL